MRRAFAILGAVVLILGLYALRAEPVGSFRRSDEGINTSSRITVGSHPQELHLGWEHFLELYRFVHTRRGGAEP